jgi:HPt (histidine-containing phosphotransfer) domain-containing protein
MGAAIISTIKKEIFNDEVLGTLIDGFERLFDAVMDKIAPKLAKILSRSVYSAFGQGALTKATGIQKKVLDDAIADTDKTLDEINETIGSRIERETLAALGHAEVQSDAEAAIVTKIKDRYRQALDNVRKARENFAGEVTADQALDQLDKAKKFQRAMSDFLLSTPTNVPSGAVKPQPVTQKVVEQVKQQVTALSEVKQRFEDEPQKYSRAIVDVATNVREATQQLKSVSDEAVQAMFSRLQAIDKVAVPLGDDFGRRVDAYASGISALRSFDPRGFVTIAKIAKDGQLEAALSGLKQMVATANELQEALGKGSANQFDLSVPLKNVAAGVGLGAKQSYQIKNKDFVINLNLKVVMEAGAVERVILQRQDSIIRDRLQNASYKGTSSPPDIPTTPSSPSPPPIGPIVK